MDSAGGPDRCGRCPVLDLIKRGTLRLLVKGQAWDDITDDSPNAGGQAHAVPRGVDDDPIAFAAALGRAGIPMVPLNGKNRPAKVSKLTKWGGGGGF